MISKKKVKGNEEAVWGEMEVLRGLDHPNIVRVVISIRTRGVFLMFHIELLPARVGEVL